jgi:hypothetical protein
VIDRRRVDAVQLAQERAQPTREAGEGGPAEQRPAGEQPVGEDAAVLIGEARYRHGNGHGGGHDLEQPASRTTL